MKGYIVLSENNTLKEGKRPFQVGNIYIIHPQLETKKGYPFVVDLENIPFLKKKSGSRIYEIETDRKDVYIPERGCICRTRNMRIVREVSLIEVREYLITIQDELLDSFYAHRQLLVDMNIALDRLVDDEFWLIRADIADKGYALDKLMKDPDPDVRKIAYRAFRRREGKEKSAV